MTPEFKNTLDFLNAAWSEGVHLTEPSYFSEANWKRAMAMIDFYYCIDEISYGDIGEAFGIRYRQTTSQILQRGLKGMWKNCSRQLQRDFPLTSLQVGKWPLKPKWIKPEPHRELIGKLRSAQTRKEKQQALGEVTTSFISYHGRYFKEDRLIMSLLELVKQANFEYQRDLHPYYEALRRAHQPAVIVPQEIKSGPRKGFHYYYIVLFKDQAENVQALREDSLSRNFLIRP